MKKIISFVAILCLSFSGFTASKNWLNSLEGAIKLSEKNGKTILMQFAGSDWCPPCIRLDKNVFSQKVFIEFAKNNLILVLIDFPQKADFPKLQEIYNKKIQEEYKAYQYPTVILIDSKGKILFRVSGYGGENAEEYIKLLKSKMPKKAEAKK